MQFAAHTDIEPLYGSRSSGTPEISFAVPAYNRPELLRQTLDSIQRIRGLENYEVIVCDDKGMDETLEVVKSFPEDKFLYFRNEKQLGGVGNWNRSISLSRGDWVTVIHEDDMFYPWFYDLVKKRLQENVSAVAVKAVQGEEKPIIQRDESLRVYNYKPSYFIKSGFTPFPGVLIRRETIEKAGTFDPEWGSLADYEYWYRLSKIAPLEVIKSTGCFYRISDTQWTNTEWSNMLRKAHKLRMIVASEQFNSNRKSKWLARFFTYRMARSYSKRYQERPATLERCLRFKKIHFSSLPSGLAWLILKIYS